MIQRDIERDDRAGSISRTSLEAAAEFAGAAAHTREARACISIR